MCNSYSKSMEWFKVMISKKVDYAYKSLSDFKLNKFP